MTVRGDPALADMPGASPALGIILMNVSSGKCSYLFFQTVLIHRTVFAVSIFLYDALLKLDKEVRDATLLLYVFLFLILPTFRKSDRSCMEVRTPFLNVCV